MNTPAASISARNALTKEHLGGFVLVDVADEDEARMWAAKAAVACGWPREVRRFQTPARTPDPSHGGA